MIRIIQWTLASIFTLFILTACVNVAPGGQGYTIAIPMQTINSTVGSNFPQNQKTSYGTLTINKPNILGQQGGNKLGLGTSFSFANMFIPNGIKGAVSLSSGVRYNASDRGLYLANPMIDNIEVHNFALSKYLTPEIKNMIGQLIAKEVTRRPIYHINNMGASLVKGIGVENGNVVVTLGL